MEYLKINDIDFSNIVSGLKVSKVVNYTSQTNASGNTVVDYINTKKNIEVSFIPLQDERMKQLLTAIDPFNITLSFRNPQSGTVETINCIVPNDDIEYYTIRADKVMYKALTITFTEL